MSIHEEPQRTACAHCGRSYRQSSWGRAYLCPACGRPLDQERPAPRAQPNRLLLQFGATLAALGMVATLGVAWWLRRPTGRPTINPAAQFGGVEPVTLPPNFRARLLEKLGLLEEDLRVAPDYPLLLSRAHQCCLSLALLAHQENRSESASWLARAREYLNRFKSLRPDQAVVLENLTNGADRVRWVAPVAQPRRLFRFVPSLSGSGGSPPGNGPFVLPSRTVAIGPSAGSTPISTPRRPLDLSDEHFEELRTERSRKPMSPEQVAELGALLESRAMGPDGQLLMGQTLPNPRQQAYALEAVGLYVSAARRSPLRAHRATFYYSASRLQGALGNDPARYEMLDQAAKATPYSPFIWQDMREVCIRLGKPAESQIAERYMREWAFPELGL